jgi:hypothetical protein
MHSRLLKHLNDNSILSNIQFGFMKNQGTDNAIYSIISGILDSLYKKMQICGIFCDLEKSTSYEALHYVVLDNDI